MDTVVYGSTVAVVLLYVLFNFFQQSLCRVPPVPVVRRRENTWRASMSIKLPKRLSSKRKSRILFLSHTSFTYYRFYTVLIFDKCCKINLNIAL